LELVTQILVFYVIIAIGVFVWYDVLLLFLLGMVFGKKQKIIEVSNKEAKEIPDYKLPVVTILLPLYKEKATIPYLIESLLKMDYPKDKMDIRFLIEDEDKETQISIKTLELEAEQKFDVRYDDKGKLQQIGTWSGVPIEIDYISTGIKTKPNALNVGLSHAKGSIITIYDAEDRPEPTQIRKVVVYMMNHPEVACVQARLAYYNPDQSLLTKFFTIEYIYQFLVSLPFLSSMKITVPLGGTSNFFHTEVLKSLDGWDPKNVTEDADLGIRLGREGYSTVPLNVTTWEEAPPKFFPWLKQRVRWNKGYLYTLVVQFRNPMKIIREIGWRSSIFTFHLLFYPIVSALSLLGWVFFGIYWFDWFGISLQPLAGWVHDAFNYNPIIFYGSLLTFAFGIMYSVLCAIEGLFRQGDELALRKVKYAFFSPLYLLLQGISATIAIVELIFKPHTWHKTHHGFSIEKEKKQEEL
jgi:cellulose synthase/poly-beta-1,6-N-acetylglucosamine synthase-like glycosyltransferase